MGRLNRLSTKSWKVENRCLISSSDTLKPSSTLTAMVNDSLWLSLRNDGQSGPQSRPAILTYTQVSPPPSTFKAFPSEAPCFVRLLQLTMFLTTV